jgi:alkylmercury lyase
MEEPPVMDAGPQQLTNRLTAAFSAADHATIRPWLWRTLLQLLSRGEPVTIGQLADATGKTALYSRSCREV